MNQNTEIFDRLLGRKGDAARLDPACKTIAKFLPQRLQAVFKRAGFDGTVEYLEKHNSSATALFARYKKGAACVLLSTRPPGAAAYMICDFPTTAVIAEMMLGGDPEFATLSAGRAPTATECDLACQFGDLVGEALQTTLSSNDRPASVRVALNADDIREGGSSGDVVAFDLKFSVGAIAPTITVAVAHSYLLKMARSEPETIRKPAAAGSGATNRRALAIKVPVTGSVTMPAITLGELASLSMGDVLPLSESGDPAIRLRVKERPLYECSLGRQGAHYALCLQRPHRPIAEVLSGIGIPLLDTEPEESHDE